MDEEKKNKIKFIVRIAVWAMFSCVIPICFIAWRYNLFHKVGTLQLSGWGLIAIVIIFVFIYSVVKYIKAGFVEWSMLKQIISGVVKVVLPLGALLALCVSLRDNLDVFIQALGCVLMCEVIAIPLNPFPEWVWKKSKGRFEGMVDFVADRFYNRGEKENKSGGQQ